MCARRLRSMLLGTGLLIGSFGCGATHPTWISEVPGSKNEMCAIGVSGPTFYAEDARVHSKTAAMTELARALEVTVTSQMTMQASGDTTGSDTAIRETAEFSSGVVLKEAQVREQWVHTGDSKQYGERGTVYTLICTSISR